MRTCAHACEHACARDSVRAWLCAFGSPSRSLQSSRLAQRRRPSGVSRKKFDLEYSRCRPSSAQDSAQAACKLTKRHVWKGNIGRVGQRLG
eukprot:6205284-Pleurochrysis_carterae.AAC.1